MVGGGAAGTVSAPPLLVTEIARLKNAKDALQPNTSVKPKVEC
jgi:hypothetical protein